MCTRKVFPPCTFPLQAHCNASLYIHLYLPTADIHADADPTMTRVCCDDVSDECEVALKMSSMMSDGKTRLTVTRAKFGIEAVSRKTFEFAPLAATSCGRQARTSK
jgi:hypothetical protein